MKVAFQAHINKKKNHQKDKKNRWGGTHGVWKGDAFF
jgi:hypothetical protein